MKKVASEICYRYKPSSNKLKKKKKNLSTKRFEKLSHFSDSKIKFFTFSMLLFEKFESNGILLVIKSAETKRAYNMY